MFSQLQNAASWYSPFISKSISLKFHGENTLSQTVLRGLTVKVGFFVLQEGFYIFSQAFPRLSFSHTFWRLSSVGNGNRALLHRSHSERCERVFLSQEISISIGLAKGAAFASSLCLSPKCSVGRSCVQSNVYSHTCVLMLQEPVGCSWAVLLPRKDWSTLAFSGLLSLWPVTCLKPTW